LSGQVRERAELRRPPRDAQHNQSVAAEGHRRDRANLMWGLLIAEAILIGSSWAISDIFGSAPKPAPAAVSGIPRTDEGAPLPLIYGRCRVRNPVLAWIGNWHLAPHGSSAIAYSLDILFVVGVPFRGGHATIQSIYAGDFNLSLIPRGPDSMNRPGRYRFLSNNTLSVYGGDQKGGGINGEIEFLDGRPDQQTSDYINDSDQANHTDLQTRQMIGRL